MKKFVFISKTTHRWLSKTSSLLLFSSFLSLTFHSFITEEQGNPSNINVKNIREDKALSHSFDNWTNYKASVTEKTVVNTRTLSIISKETYEDQYKNEVPFKHIIRLKSLNPEVSFRSIPETKERLSKISFPSSPAIQAYHLYSGSFLIVEISKK